MKFAGCAVLLTVSVAYASKLTLRSVSSKADAVQSCTKIQCPRAWRPKLNHHTITGKTVADCCEKTCELFKCTGAYRENEAYWGNVGDSPQVCCDKTCGTDFECDVGFVLADATSPGVSKKECCKPKCELFTCEAPWANSSAKKDVVSSSAEDCCDQTCAAVNCSATGWAVDPSKATKVGSTVEDCCAPLCSNAAAVTCPAGMAVKPEDAEKKSDGTTEGCCQKQCKAHKCSDGWAPDVSKADDFADTDEACCAKTCKLFECPVADGWTTWESVANDIGDNVTQCCLPTCKQFTCNATENWLPVPGNAKDDVAGSNSETCCKPACHTYSCSPAKGLMQLPDAATTPGASDEECCESSTCEKVRTNMTKMGDDEYCNSEKTKEDCEKKFSKHTVEKKVDNKTVTSTSIVTCRFDETYNLCRYDMKKAIQGGCSGV